MGVARRVPKFRSAYGVRTTNYAAQNDGQGLLMFWDREMTPGVSGRPPKNYYCLVSPYLWRNDERETQRESETRSPLKGGLLPPRYTEGGGVSP